MKNWKIITMATSAVVAASLLILSLRNGHDGRTIRRLRWNDGRRLRLRLWIQQPTLHNKHPSNQANQPHRTNNSILSASLPIPFRRRMMRRLGNGHGFSGMMSGYGYTAPYTYTGTTTNINNAATIAQNYVASIGNPDLVVKQVEEYSANFYVQVNEKSTGNGAFELLINKYTGSIYPEMGPNMMWNTKYGMMRGGILGGIFGTPTTTMPVTAAQAKANAQTIPKHLPARNNHRRRHNILRLLHHRSPQRRHNLWHAKRQRLQRTSLGPHLARNLHPRTPSKLSNKPIQPFPFFSIQFN